YTARNITVGVRHTRRREPIKTLEDTIHQRKRTCLHHQRVYTRHLPMRPFRIEDTSMQPALQPGDRLLVSNWLSVRTGDLVVFRDPEAPSTWLVKRVARLIPGGDVVV